MVEWVPDYCTSGDWQRAFFKSKREAKRFYAGQLSYGYKTPEICFGDAGEILAPTPYLVDFTRAGVIAALNSF